MNTFTEDDVKKMSDEELDQKIQEVDALITEEKNRRVALLAELNAAEEEFKRLREKKDQEGIEDIKRKIMES